MRLFVALDLDTQVRAALERATAPMAARHPDLAWTDPETWHVTLAFLGEVADDRGDEVVAAVSHSIADARARPRRLAVGAPGRFGRRVLWVGVDDAPLGTVAGLGAAVQEALAGRDLPVSATPVVAHITLVRARGRRGVLPARLEEELGPVDASWPVDHVTVVRSHLGATVRHEPLATVALD